MEDKYLVQHKPDLPVLGAMFKDGKQVKLREKTCIACKSKNLRGRGMQSRSADEGAHIVYECMDCHKTQTIAG